MNKDTTWIIINNAFGKWSKSQEVFDSKTWCEEHIKLETGDRSCAAMVCPGFHMLGNAAIVNDEFLAESRWA